MNTISDSFVGAALLLTLWHLITLKGMVRDLTKLVKKQEQDKVRVKCDHIFARLRRELRRRVQFSFIYDRGADYAQMSVGMMGSVGEYTWLDVVVNTHRASSDLYQLSVAGTDICGCEDDLVKFVDELIERHIEIQKSSATA